MFSSDWITLTLDYDRSTTEFSGDDADRYTELLDLKDDYEYLLVLIPALSSSAAVTPYIQKDAEIDTVPIAMVVLDADATGHFAHATSSGGGSLGVIFRIGATRFLRLYCDANQGADRVFYVKGFNRVVFGT